MDFPKQVRERVDDNGTPYSYMIDRYQREQSAISAALRAAGFVDLKRVVDYGCNVGGWTWPLADTCEKVIGIDIKQGYIDAAKEIAAANNMRNVSYQCAADLAAIADRSVDGIVSVGTLQVVGTGAFWHSFFRDAARVLTPDGRVLVNFASPLLPIEFLLRMEGLSYLRRSGWRYALTRMRMWIILSKRSLAGEIVEGGSYYAVRRSVARALIAQYGFEELESTELAASLTQHKIESFHKGRWPHYTWMLCGRSHP